MITSFDLAKPLILAISSFILLTGSILSAPAAPFPRAFKAPRAEIQKITPPEGIVAAWKTKNFLFLSDQEIDSQTIRRFATTMESVPALLSALPTPLWAPQTDQPATVRLCLNEDRFEALGGPTGSSGFYDGRRQMILIRADVFLTPRTHERSRLTPAPNEDLLVHELCHLGMDRILINAKPWVYEGLAEFFAASHQGEGHYRFDNIPQAIRDQFRSYVARGEGGTLKLPPVQHILKTSNRAWIKEIAASNPEDRYRPYAASLLLVHYHLEGGAERRNEFLKYLKTLQSLPPRRRSKKPLDEPALEPASEIETRLKKYWTSRGLQLVFSEH